MKQICLARALFFTGICIISSFVSSKGGAAWKIEVFSVFSFVPLANKYTIAICREEKGQSDSLGKGAYVRKWYR